MASQFGNQPSGINPLTHRDVAENIDMSRWHWETKLLRFERMKSQPRTAEAWPWVGLLFATVPSLVANNSFEVDFLFLDKRSWQLMFGVFALLSLLNLGRIFAGATVGWFHERDFSAIRWLVRRPPDWVPTNVAAFVEDVVREIQQDRAKVLAVGEATDGLSGTLDMGLVGHGVGTEASTHRVPE